MINFLTKKNLIITGSVLVLSALGGTVAMATTSNNKAGADTSPIVTTLDNHETRIKNAENNIKVLQTKTGSTDSTDNTSVPAVNATSTTTSATSSQSVASDSVASVPAASIPVVVSYKEIPLDADNSDCQYIYSDGSAHRFEWKRTNPQGTWMTDGSGQNGHWVKTINKTGVCDESAIGSLKQDNS